LNTMPQFSRMQITLRYAALTAFLIVFAALRRHGDIDLIVLAFIVVFSLKYMAYDAAVGYSVKRFKLHRNYWHLIGYGTAAAIDLSFLFAATGSDIKSQFALLGLIIVTPWILLAGYFLSLLEVFVIKMIKLT
jgi:hypothetical protein